MVPRQKATNARNKAYARSGVRAEEEELLPPGTLVFKAVHRDDHKYVIDVRYVKPTNQR